jgi:alcohol dehydrogenase
VAPHAPPAVEPFEGQVDSLRVVSGPGTLRRIGEVVADLGTRRALLVTDPGVRRAGHAGRAASALVQAGLEVAVFDGVEENPGEDHVAAGVAAAEAHAADCIVAVGGGSSMDCAKGTNFILTNGGSMEDYRGHAETEHPMLPSVAAPTTAGTGSEGQSYALITRRRDRMKMACGAPGARFRAAILDPDLIATVPVEVTAVTGMDAVSHAVESYVTNRGDATSRGFALEAWRRLEESFEALVSGEGAGDHKRGAMLTGAFLAGLAIEHSMLGAAHACANPLTAHYGVTHGIAVGLMLPHVVRFNAEQVGEMYETLHPGAPGAHQGHALSDRIAALRSAAGLPAHLRDYGIPRERLPRLAGEAASQWTAGFNPRPVDERDLLELYEAAY